MAEYYTVLRKAIGGLDSNQAEARRTVYDKARNALIGQLKAVDPPLTTAEISRQRLELEEAIRKVEREAAASPGPVRAPARPAAPPPAPSPARIAPAPNPVRMAPVPMPADEPADDGGPSPQDVFRRAIQEAESRGSAAGAAAGAIERAANVMRAEANQYGGANADLRPPRDRVERALPPPAPMPRDEPPAEEYDPRDRAPPEPRLAPEYTQDWDNRSADAPAIDRRDRPNLPVRRKRGYLEEDDRQALEREARPSRLPSLLLTILILAVIGGVGALGWSNRTMLTQIIDGLDGKKPGKAKLTPPAVADAGAPSSKDTDRLPGAEAPPAKIVRSVEPPSGDAGSAAPDAAAADTAAPPADAGISPEPAAGASADEASPASPAAPLVASADDDADVANSLVAQKAMLYEEPVDATGDGNNVTAINAKVSWRYVENGANGPQIEADLLVPERNMKVKLTIHKNGDKSLPASHLIEIQIDAPADLPGKSVKKVPRLVMKPTEEAHGQPLVGIDAKITAGYFWIALSGADADLSANLALLRERDWIDLPFVYETGQRAILTFEKGTPGERVFQKAMAAWTTG